MQLYIAIDDTDNLESRGTGFRIRQMAQELAEHKLAIPYHVTRHQLLVDPAIPYTSHNSSACLIVNDATDKMPIINFCRDFLLRESAEGSDSGLCVAEPEQIDEDIIHWGKRAKKEVLLLENSFPLAANKGIYLEGLLGTRGGAIGALAAVGLRKTASDGRFLWMKNLRETTGTFTRKELETILEFDELQSTQGVPIGPDEQIDTGKWPRPVLYKGKIIIFAEKSDDHEHGHWKIASKEFIQSVSS